MNDLNRKDTIFDDKNIKSFIVGNCIDINHEKLKDEVEILKYSFGYKFIDEVGDYFINKNPISKEFDNGNILISGERRFLYLVFKKIYSNDETFKDFHELFYAYLLIKERLRDELIQVNNKIGFDNFQNYQNRKSKFIPDNSIYEKALYYMAVKGSLNNQKITKFETRFAPKDTVKKLNKTIKNLDNSIYNSKEFEIKDYENLFIIV